MLIPGLENESLFQMASRSDADYLEVHKLLRKCARDMLGKYRQQMEQGYSDKLRVKRKAVKILLNELSKVPEDSREISEAISSALERYAEALQGYEHLLSENGNNYALVKQSQCLSANPHVQPSLLRYHELIKKRLLGPDTFLSGKQQYVMFKLAKKKGLTLRMLDTLDKNTVSAIRALHILEMKNLLEPDFCARVIENEYPENAAIMLVSLKKSGLFNPELFTAVLKYTEEREKMRAILSVFDELVKFKLHQPDNCLAVAEHEDFLSVLFAILALSTHGLLTRENLDKVIKHKDPGCIATVFRCLETLCARRDNLYAVIDHPDIAKLASEIKDLKESGKLDQDSFNRCLAETGFVAYA